MASFFLTRSKRAFLPLFFFLLLALSPSSLGAEELTGKHFLVLYNKNAKESQELALKYAEARKVPSQQVIGLDCSDKEEITREEYNTSFVDPLLALAQKKGWWPTKGGKIQDRQIYGLVLMKGLPLKIRRDKPQTPKGPVLNTEACVDSELSCLSLGDYALTGMINNPYFEELLPFIDRKLPSLLVSRVDALHYSTCHSLLEDTWRAEAEGLSGWTVVDKGGPFKQGDDWMTTIATQSDQEGLPALLDSFPKTLPKNYPLPGPLMFYFGWYTPNLNGPFLAPSVPFARGAIAAHLHSFSASTLRKAEAGWCAGLLEKGAVATVGNVYEPYLHTSHHFDLFHNRLLEGFCLAEAASMSIPCLSWQNVVIGDPLYRPFKNKRTKTFSTPQQKAQKAWSLALQEWKNDLPELEAQISSATERMRLPLLSEALALYAQRQKNYPLMSRALKKAQEVALSPQDKLRLGLHEVALFRLQGQKAQALEKLDALKITYGNLPEGEALLEWEQILRPKPPEGQKKR